jgi:hypothetical protein
MQLDTSIPMRDTGMRQLGNDLSNTITQIRQGNVQRQETQKMNMIKQALTTAPDEETGLARAYQIDPIIGQQLRDEYTKTKISNEQLKSYALKYKDDVLSHIGNMKKINDETFNIYSNIVNGAFEDENGNRLDPINDADRLNRQWGAASDMIKKIPHIDEESGQTVMGLPDMPKTPDGGYARMLKDRYVAITKSAISPTALLIQADTPENRKVVDDQITLLEQDPNMDKSVLSTIRATNKVKGQGAPIAMKMLSEYISKAQAPVQAAAGKMPIEIATEAGKAQAVQPIKVETEKQVAQVKADVEAGAKAKEKGMERLEPGTLETADKVLTAITEIESNPTVLEKAPAGVKDLLGVVSQYVPAENAAMYTNNLQRITDVLKLEARQKLKGQGQISNMETDMLANAETNLSKGTPKQRVAELDRIKTLYKDVKYRAQNGVIFANGVWNKIDGGKLSPIDESMAHAPTWSTVKQGESVDGFKYIGGDRKSPASWEKQ